MGQLLLSWVGQNKEFDMSAFLCDVVDFVLHECTVLYMSTANLQGCIIIAACSQCQAFCVGLQHIADNKARHV